jgi:hypothetical protein
VAILNDDAADVTLVAAAAVNTDAAIAADPLLRLLGYTIKETVAAAAEFEVVHGATGAGGTGLGAHHHLVASESKERWFGPSGVKIPNGLSIRRAAGTAKVALYTKKVI